jgi:hypothetical protein
MWKHLLEGLAGFDTRQLSAWRKRALELLGEAGLLLGLLAATSWLVRP